MLLLEEQITEARRNVESGQRIIDGQHKFIALLKKQGRSTLRRELAQEL